MKKDANKRPKNGSNKSNIVMYWLLMLTLIFLSVSVVFIISMVNMSSDFKTFVDKTTKQNEEYEDEISNLQQKVAFLAENITAENENKNLEEAKKNPIGIPVSGNATIISEPKESADSSFWGDDTSTEGESFEDSLMNPYTLEISVEKGAKIIAAGNGIVEDVAEDDLYGYIVKINHQNGYMTVYRYDEEPKINKGDEVLKGQMIFEVSKNKGILAYHILYENTYINPFDMIEISG